MTLNIQSWEYYNQQPWNILRWGIYYSQEFHDNNIHKTMHLVLCATFDSQPFVFS